MPHDNRLMPVSAQELRHIAECIEAAYPAAADATRHIAGELEAQQDDLDMLNTILHNLISRALDEEEDKGVLQ